MPFTKFEVFNHYFFKYRHFFPALIFSPLPLVIYNTNIDPFDIVPQVSKPVFKFFHFFPSLVYIGYFVSSSSVTLSSVISIYSESLQWILKFLLLGFSILKFVWFFFHNSRFFSENFCLSIHFNSPDFLEHGYNSCFKVCVW